MSLDLLASLTEEVGALLGEALRVAGAVEPPQLAPPTLAGAGDLSLSTHRYAKALRKAPDAIATMLAEVARQHPLVSAAEVKSGFLNLTFSPAALAERTVRWALSDDGALGRSQALAGQRVLIEYSSPNTNKPQHLGHCRNNVLGQVTANLLTAAGAEVSRFNLINDRGIHICKSMVAWRRFAEGATPASKGQKGDHFVGDLYVAFDQALRAEYAAAFPAGGGPEVEVWFNQGSGLGREAAEMLVAWERGDEAVLSLWRMMNGWVEVGFFETYARMGIRFDHIQRESEIWQKGRALVAEGLERGVFGRAENGAVVFDLRRIGLEGEKAVLRADGTALYITQDLGTALSRDESVHPTRMVYVVGNEQEHYFRVLFGIIGELRPHLKGQLVHRSYGMVELPTGRMKSREGTVVDADDLMDELRDAVLAQNQEVRWAAVPAAEQADRAEKIGLAGLKYYLMRFSPERTFVFEKETSISFEGDTGPYCQYAWARAENIIEKAGDSLAGVSPDWGSLDEPHARRLIAALLNFPSLVRKGATDLDPSMLARAVYELSKSFASFYAAPEGRVIGAAPGTGAARLALVKATRRVLGAGLDLLGVATLTEM